MKNVTSEQQQKIAIALFILIPILFSIPLVSFLIKLYL